MESRKDIKARIKESGLTVERVASQCGLKTERLKGWLATKLTRQQWELLEWGIEELTGYDDRGGDCNK